MPKTTYVLEMDSPDQLRPKRVDRPELRVERVEVPSPEFSKFLHSAVGYNHRWGGRSHWTREDWLALVSDPALETWVAYLKGMPAGYFEVRCEPVGSVEIVCFGLLPEFVGEGLGGHLLTLAVERAWELGDGPVSLHTCTHDHPHALANYQARGFRISHQSDGPENPPMKSLFD